MTVHVILKLSLLGDSALTFSTPVIFNGAVFDRNGAYYAMDLGTDKSWTLIQRKITPVLFDYLQKSFETFYLWHFEEGYF